MDDKYWVKIRERYQVKIDEDKYKEERLKKCLCKKDYYNPLIGGAALTKYICENCGKECIHGTTATPRYCLDCARNKFVCRYCLEYLGEVKPRGFECS